MRMLASDLPIVLRDVAVFARGLAILAGIRLELMPGAPTVLIGPNGAGKTTLLRVAMGLIGPGSGEVTWGGRAKVPPARRAFVLQRPVMLRRSVAANVAYALATIGLPRADRAARIAELLDLVGLAGLGARPARRLSGGEQQRLALARAVLFRPDWLFLDEATSAVDEKLEAELYAMLAQRLPDTTIMSIGHRSAVAALHQRHIEMAPEGDHFTLREVPKAEAAE
jgi:tungstate transport system ATP-binding protein